MTAAIGEGLERLLAAVDKRRAAMERRKRDLLKGEPTWSAGRELIVLNEQLQHLRLAEDVLDDALSALERIDNAAEDAA